MRVLTRGVGNPFANLHGSCQQTAALSPAYGYHEARTPPKRLEGLPWKSGELRVAGNRTPSAKPGSRGKTATPANTFWAHASDDCGARAGQADQGLPFPLFLDLFGASVSHGDGNGRGVNSVSFNLG